MKEYIMQWYSESMPLGDFLNTLNTAYSKLSPEEKATAIVELEYADYSELFGVFGGGFTIYYEKKETSVSS